MSEKIEFLQIDEFCKRAEAEWNRRCALHPKDPEHPSGTNLDMERGYVDVWWGGYEYSIKLDDIKSPRHVCEWLVHLSEKSSWNATHEQIGEFVKDVFFAKGWDVYADGPKSRATAADEERGKLTPQLRWGVLKRDGYRCRACGSGPENGAVLHIDHIKPIVNGGETLFDNLQTLCACCNFGKARS